MRNTFIILQREYLERVRTKGFLIATILAPVLFAAMVALPAYFATRPAQQQRVAIAETGPAAGQLVPLLEQRLAHSAEEQELKEAAPGNPSTNVRARRAARAAIVLEGLKVAPGQEQATRQRLAAEVLAHKIDSFVWVDGDPAAGGTVEYNAESVTNFSAIGAVRDLVSSAVIELRLKSRGIVGSDVESLVKRIDMKTVRLSKEGAREDKGAAFITSYFFVFLLYMTLIIYGVMVMRSVIEEKTSRIFEVLLSAVKPRDLMAGKILGIAGVGLTQYLIWAGLAFLAGGGLGLLAVKNAIGEISIPALTLVFLVVYFVLGFLLYSTMFAALGAIVNSEQEAQQLQVIIMQFLILPMLLLVLVLNAPNGNASTVLSLIPLFAPILMLLRITLTQVPAWQIALSVVLLILTNLGILWVSARIYRVGILMYGKRPTLPELWRWLKAA